jgi:glycosyltransferase involved in cell wall biosynthesis
MKFTIAICTWSRAPMLRRALASHAAVLVPRGVEREVVVVDNGSTDETPEVVAEFGGRLPIRRVSEPTPGLSHARNAAVRAARGDYILWTDDDVLVPPNWMEVYAEAIRRWPEAAVFGGPIRPQFDATPPRWLARALPVVANAYALLDLGDAPAPFSERAVPFGANYVVRTAEQRLHPYSPRLGRVHDKLTSGEETAVVRAILADGGTGWYVPTAGVRHLLAPERLTERYLRRYYVAQHARADDLDVPKLLGRPRWAWRVAIENELLYLVTRPFGSPERWLAHLRRASEGWGLLRAAAPSGRPDEWRPSTHEPSPEAAKQAASPEPAVAPAAAPTASASFDDAGPETGAR